MALGLRIGLRLRLPWLGLVGLGLGLGLGLGELTVRLEAVFMPSEEKIRKFVVSFSGGGGHCDLG